MAEEERFELSEGFHPRWFSRPVHLTALPPLRDRAESYYNYSRSQTFNKIANQANKFGEPSCQFTAYR